MSDGKAPTKAKLCADSHFRCLAGFAAGARISLNQFVAGR